MTRVVLTTSIALLLLGLTARGAAAIDIGGQLIYGDDTDVGLGARVEIATPDLLEDTRIAADFNWYFPDDPPGTDLTIWETNLNWLLQVAGSPDDAAAYLGGGLNFVWSSVDYDGGGDDSDRDLGVNFLGGGSVPMGGATAFGEIRITIGGSEQYTLAAGVLF